MEFFDIRKMPVSLWRNGAGETREILLFSSATRVFLACQHCDHRQQWRILLLFLGC